MTKPSQKRRVLITGGTGSVGRALCKAFLANGDVVTFQYRNQEGIAKRIVKSGGIAIRIDFEKGIELPAKDFDVVVNNAGINITQAATHDVSLENWNKTILANLTAPFLVAQQCLPWMIKKKWGRIINISSIYGLRAVEGNCPYTVSKHALAGLTKTIAKEYAPFGITCNEICPGPIESDMMQRIAKQEAMKEGETVKNYFREVREGIPAGRLAEPNDVANLAIFLASPQASYLTGASIPLDGGMIT